MSGKLTVTPAPLTITAENKTKVYGAQLPTLTASYSGLVNGDSAASLTTPPTLTTAATAGSHVSGNLYPITGSGAVDADYTISYMDGTLTVTPAALTITADDKSKVYGAALPALTASYTGFVNGDSAESLTTQPTLSTTATASSHVPGSPYAITANGAVDADYTISYVPGTLTVTPATLIVKANDTSRTYGETNPTFTDTISGFVNGDSASVVGGAASLSTTATPASAPGSYPITAAAGTVSAADYSFVFQNGTLTVTQPQLSGVTTASASGGVEGVTPATLTGATFTDTDTTAAPSDFSITAINWGDGSTNTTGLTISASGGSYTVTSSHLYADEGVRDFTITVSDAGGSNVTITGTASIADAPVTGVSTATVSGGVEGVTPATLRGATFSDANAAAPLTDLSIAAVSWGDGSTSTTGLSISGNGGSYTVTGSHLYSEEGTYPVSIAIKDMGGSTATITGTANVADAPLSATGSSVSTTAGSTFSGIVATFSDGDTSANDTDYSATIDWGDGTSLTTVSGSAMTQTGPGAFSLPGSRVYAEAGTYTLTVTINDVGGSVATAHSTATVAQKIPFSVAEDIYVISSRTISVGASNGVLANDAGPSQLSVTNARVAVHGENGGTFVFNADGSFTYTPGANFPGFDYAQYTAEDTVGDKGTGTVYVLSQSAADVWKLYEEVLDRGADNQGLAYWLGQFAHGTGSYGQIAQGFFLSTELLKPVVDAFYEATRAHPLLVTRTAK